MKITNKASYAIIAFGVATQHGYGEDVRIEPGQTANVSGPYIGEMDGGKCFIHIEGEITCQETPDDDIGFQVVRGGPLCLQSGDRGITARHHADAPEPHVIQWRRSNAGATISN